MKALVTILVLLATLFALPGTASAATCSDYSTQADAQAAADTRDADGDGIYCESLPCPCAHGGGSSAPAPPPPPPPPPPAPKPKPAGCLRPSSVVVLTFSGTKYPNIKAHTLAAIAKGWPRVMVLNRKGSEQRRDRLLDDPVFGLPTKPGFDRDEYPAAVGRGKQRGKNRGLIRGINPLGWLADVAYVPSAENRSHGSSLGAKLKRYCNGTQFRYRFS